MIKNLFRKLFWDSYYEYVNGYFYILVFVVLISVFIPSIIFAVKNECLSKYEDYNPKWGFWSDCRIEYQGKLTPVDMIKNINLNQ